MAKYTLPDYTYVWAEGGSAVMPPNEKIQRGWIKEKPLADWQNGLNQRSDVAIKYILQHGIAEWNDQTDYLQTVTYIVGSNGIVYQCIKDNGISSLLVDPVTSSVSTEYWSPFAKDIQDTLKELASTNGAGLVGYLSTNSYPPNTVGETINDILTSNAALTDRVSSLESNYSALSQNVGTLTSKVNNLQTAVEGSVKSVNSKTPDGNGNVKLDPTDIKIIDDTTSSTTTTYSSQKIEDIKDSITQIDDTSISTTSTYSSQKIIDIVPKIILSPIAPSEAQMQEGEIWLVYKDDVAPDQVVFEYYNWNGFKMFAEANSTVVMEGGILNDTSTYDWQTIETFTVGADGVLITDQNYFLAGSTLGLQMIRFTATDISGNVSEPLDIPVGDTPVTVPTPKYNNKTRLQGLGKAGDKVEIYANETHAVVVDSTGVWTFEPNPLMEMAEDFSGTVVEYDVFGFYSANVSVGVVDRVAPDAPYVAVNTPEVLSGTSEAGATITVYFTSGEIATSMTVREDSTWSFIPNPLSGLGGGYAITTDVAGNDSERTEISAVGS